MMKRLTNSYARFLGVTTKRSFTIFAKSVTEDIYSKKIYTTDHPNSVYFLNSASPVIAEQCSHSVI
jgi:hypothetical protein